MLPPPSANLPIIRPHDPFVTVVRALSDYVVDEINTPSTFEQLRTTSAGTKIRALVEHLVRNVTNPALVNALLTLKWHFSTLDIDDRGINETRASACEIVAWRFLTSLSERDAVNFCLYELPATSDSASDTTPATGTGVSERSTLLPQFRAADRPVSPLRSGSKRSELLRSVSHIGGTTSLLNGSEDIEEGPASSFTGLNGLEIAAVADCKKFLSQRIVQKIITGIWNGDITFWESLSVGTIKKPQFYNPRHSDAFTRLRVPRYIKAFEVLFFATFLFLYYAVLVERNPMHITPLEVALYIWFAAFSYDELGEFIDAGSLFYGVDIWNGCDIIIILIGGVFLLTRIIGLSQNNAAIIDTAFDILSLEALFMVPRICSLLSLHPYFGTLIPCLKEMAKDFVKFMVVVTILYLGFLTTFTLLARDTFSLSYMSWILIKVFFGSSYLGFDIMDKINAKLGPPLMLVFVCMTNILLVTSLISILSNSFSRVISRAREEYLFVYSVYVLEASTSNRLVHFYPPLNLIPLILIRPLRLFVTAEKLRRTRIALLKATHLPIVAAIWAYEQLHERIQSSASSFSSKGPGRGHQTIDSDRSCVSWKQPPFLSSGGDDRTLSGHVTGLSTDGPSVPDPKNDSKCFTGVEQCILHVRDTRLEEEVRELRMRITELTTLILAQQGAGNEE